MANEERTESMLAQKSTLSAATVLLSLIAAIDPVSAYTDTEVTEIFRVLDTNQDGKVTREEYAANKVAVIYRNVPGGAPNLTFDQTRVSRTFFDAADVNHDGVLSPTEIMNALPFEAVDPDNKGYFLLDDLRRFLKKIGP
jgi:Ca2+-binding EF-hand superfamily protein